MKLHALIAATLAASLSLAACKKSGDVRCANCGMKVDSASAFQATAEAPDGASSRRTFDSPKCALAARKPNEKIRAQEYYSRQWRAVDDDVVFVGGSDVLGPMGHDLIPVQKSQAELFRKEHGGSGSYSITAIPPEKAMDLAE